VRTFDDENIIKGIKDKDNSVLEFVYKKFFPLIKWKLIHKDSFTDEDAKDIFQDAMIIIYKNVIQKDFHLKFSFKTFLFTICRNIIIKRLESESSKIEKMDYLYFQDVLDENAGNDILSVNEFELTEEIKRGLLRKHFFTISKSCQEVLKMFANGISFKIISNKIGFNNENHAYKQKHWCKEQLIKKIKEDKLYRTIFTKE
jgi:RNA polymerase sigma factor (sigma-70 family)